MAGDAGCFSFSQPKHLTTAGEGGMVTARREEVAAAVRSLRDYGREARPLEGGAEIPLAHVRVGWNYRMTEVQAAIGLAEIDRLDAWNLQRRRGFAKAYDHAFGQLAGVRALPLDTEERRNAYWYYPLQLDLPRLTCDARRVREAIAAEGVPVGPAPWPEVYREPAFAGRCRGEACPVAEELSARTVALCLHPTWERGHVETVVAAVKKVLRAFKR
jgi:dTDP-4-amino-4,6-dideoxygalactose transaminase